MAPKSVSSLPSGVQAPSLLMTNEGSREGSMVRMPFQVMARIGSYLSDQDNARLLATRKNLLNCRILQIIPKIMAMIGSYLSPSENGRLLITCRHFMIETHYREEIEAMFRMKFRAEIVPFWASLFAPLPLFKEEIEEETNALTLESVEKTDHHIRLILLRLFLSLSDEEFKNENLNKCGCFITAYRAAKLFREQRAQGEHPFGALSKVINEDFISEAIGIFMMISPKYRDPRYPETLASKLCQQRRFSVAIAFIESLPLEQKLNGFSTIACALARQGLLRKAIRLTNEYAWSI